DLRDSVHVRAGVRGGGPAPEAFVALEDATGSAGLQAEVKIEISRGQSDPWVVPDFRRACTACRRSSVRKRSAVSENRRIRRAGLLHRRGEDVMRKQFLSSAIAATALMALAAGVQAKDYGPGVTDTEIKIGNIMPYSGPASAYGTIGKAEAAYFQYINEQGGINGRKINFISLDDGYSPPKTVEQARKLVEQDEVLLLFQPLGTPPNSAIHKYMNSKKVPQLFVATGASKWNDTKNFPWTMGWQPNYPNETKNYAKHILKNTPNAKIAVLYQNDDYGKDYLHGLKEGLGDKDKTMIVSEVSY